uniref:C2H2-type domain-containing protein n=1 Tax=Kryptolebias marmoratus TaxID=37003 RepID=A0A3Q3F4J7_KRYMA
MNLSLSLKSFQEICLYFKYEPWTSLEGEQLGVKEETDATGFTVPLKSEDDEEKPLLSQLHQHQAEDNQIKLEADGEDCGGAEISRNTDLNTRDLGSCSSETEVIEDGSQGHCSQLEHLSDSGSKTKNRKKNWKESRSLKSGRNSVSKPFSCSECGKEYVYNRSLQRHKTIQTRQKSFRCDDCGKTFNRKGTLQTHMRIHTGEKPFSCDLCGLRFSDRSVLNRHNRIHTGQKTFGCGVCGQRFRNKTNVTTHMRIHTGEKPFSCGLCGLRFSDRSALNRHKRIHTGQKTFPCDLCGQKFNRKANLNSHMRIHTGEKPIPCDVCGQRFRYKTNLNTHMKIHTGEKPFPCDSCEQRFRHKISLNMHMKIHTGQKPYSCGVCGQQFSEKRNINKHVRIHPGNEAVIYTLGERRQMSTFGHVNHIRSRTIGERTRICKTFLKVQSSNGGPSGTLWQKIQKS